MKFIPYRKKFIAALMIGAIAGGMAPIFHSGQNTLELSLSIASVAQAASCPTPTRRYQEEAKKGSDSTMEEEQESPADNILKAGWRIALLVAAVSLVRIGWKRFAKKSAS